MAARDARGHGSSDKDPRFAELTKRIQRIGLPPDPKPMARIAGRVRRALLHRRGRT